jgi:predicted O-methyltransferase YrrM
MQNFRGHRYRVANNWLNHVNINEYYNTEIKYLEVGAFYGANVISVAGSYGLHKDSKLYCIDPWEDYEDYPEYKGEQENTYSAFLNNINNCGVVDKVNVIRGYSNIEIPKFEDSFFDIIYLDGNHEPDYVLEDAVLSFRKLKAGGILIFDDYGWRGPDLTTRGIDAFISGYHKRIEYLGEQETQVFVKKIK